MPVEPDQKMCGGVPVRILCVDDERNVLRALERLFIDYEYEIVSCISGEEGLKELESGGLFQVVISDYRMPGMNGVAFLKQVYARWPETVRIVLSGYADTGAIVDAINHGHIYKFIPKPWNDDDLRITITNALERYQLRHENDELLRRLQDSNHELSILNSNLENMVRERTKSLELHNRALTITQSVLENLPVAVMGVDSNCMIIQCNRACRELFKPFNREILGASCPDLLPPKCASQIVEGLADESSHCGTLEVAGKTVHVAMKSFSMFDNKVYVLAFHPEEE
jgi:two-component system, NtrC family, sensor kinase